MLEGDWSFCPVTVLTLIKQRSLETTPLPPSISSSPLPFSLLCQSVRRHHQTIQMDRVSAARPFVSLVINVDLRKWKRELRRRRAGGRFKNPSSSFDDFSCPCSLTWTRAGFSRKGGTGFKCRGILGQNCSFVSKEANQANMRLNSAPRWSHLGKRTTAKPALA